MSGDSRSEWSDAGAEWRTRGVGQGASATRRICRNGRRAAAESRSSGGAKARRPCRHSAQQSDEVAARSGPRGCSAGARPPRSLGASPRFRGARGHAAPPQGAKRPEPRADAQAERDTDPPSSAAEVIAGAQGWSGVPAGHSTPDAEPSDSSAARAPSLRSTSACAGGAGLHRTEHVSAEEDAGCVTALLARSVPLGDWRTLRLGACQESRPDVFGLARRLRLGLVIEERCDSRKVKGTA